MKSLAALTEPQQITVEMHDEGTGHPLPALVLTPAPLDGLSRQRLLVSVERLVRERYGPLVAVSLLTDEEGETDPVFVAHHEGQVLARGGMEVG